MPNPNPTPLLSELNPRSAALCQQAITDAEMFDIHVTKIQGVTLLDFGVDRDGTLAAGELLARICLADLADVSLHATDEANGLLPEVCIDTDAPLHSCIASQYAGWPFAPNNYFAMCSGPARIARGKEDLLTKYHLTTESRHVVAVFETNELPSATIVEKFLSEFSCRPERAIICLARTNSLPGSFQVVARSVETAMHKLNEIGFDLTRVLRGKGTAPLPPIGKTSLQSLGWTNDSILYGTHVDLWIETDLDEAEALCQQLPSNSSDDYGRPFSEIFAEYDNDFYKIDRMLFSPASVSIHLSEHSQVCHGGEVRWDILKQSFQLN